MKKIFLILNMCACALLGLMGCARTAVPEASASPTPHRVELSLTHLPTHSPTPRPTASPSPSPTPAPTPRQLAPEEESPLAAQVQQRLMELGYLQTEAPSGICDAKTREAMDKFLWQTESEEQTPDEGYGEAAIAALLAPEAPAFDEFLYLAPTIRMSFAELIGDNGDWELPLGYPPADTYRIIVDIAHQVTMVYTRDEDGAYTVPVRYMLCSTGLGSRTPVGTFSMGAYRLRFSLFDRDGRYGQYWTQIRRAIYFHTTLYTRRDAASYQASTFRELGEKASHGCIRLTVPDARWMWYHIAPGTSCTIRQGNPSDKETAAIRAKLTLAQPPAEQLKLVPGQIPDTDNYEYLTLSHEVPFVQGSQNGN